MNRSRRRRREALGDDPGRIERLDGAEARDDGGLEARRREDEEVPGEGGIVGLLEGESEIEIDERRHEEGLAGAHGEGEQVVGIGNPVEEIAEHGGGVDRLRIVLEPRSQGGRKDAAPACDGLRGELQEGEGVGMRGEMVAHGLRDAEVAGVDRVQDARGEDVAQRLVATGDLEEQIGLDGVDLHRTQTAATAHVVQLCAQRAIRRARPRASGILDEVVDHG